MPRAVGLAAVVAVAALLSAGCGEPAAGSASGPDWTATLSWTPRSILPMRETSLQLRLVGPGGRPLTLERITAEAVMPEMSHRGEPVHFRPAGPGRYGASYTFSMGGVWEIRVSGLLDGSGFLTTFRLVVGE